MNDRAREVLVTAALNGVKQIKGNFVQGDGMCALGLLEHATGRRLLAHTADFRRYYGMEIEEPGEIIEANDDLGWDFLTIARKIGAA